MKLHLALALLGSALACGCGRSGYFDYPAGGPGGGPCASRDCPPDPGPDAGGGGRDMKDGGPGNPDARIDSGHPDLSDCHLKPEICDNGVDDNCDGLVDCADPECAALPACAPPGKEICNNGIDDDKNGLTDCADPACANFPGCQMMHMCDPRNVNCADPACVNDPACQNLVCKPTVDFGSLAHNYASSERMFSTSGTTDVAKTMCAPAGGGQVVTTFEVLADQTSVRMDFKQGMGADNAFGLFRAGVNQKCEANPIECYDPKAAPSGTHSWVLDKGHYFLIAIAFTKGHQGALDVTLSTPTAMKKEICNNGIDDDGNGLIDCADPACFADASCVNKECVPDVVLGTIIPTDGTPGSGKQAHVDTRGGNPDFRLQCGGTGRGRAVQFSLAESAGIGVVFDGQTGDHVFDLYKKPPPGQPCDALDTNACELLDVGLTWALGNGPGAVFGAGDYILIVQAIKPGDEGTVDMTIFTYKPKKIELCHNGVDDDNNGLTDCADPACFNDAGCGPPVCSPDVAFGDLNIGARPKMAALDLTNGVPKLASSCTQGGGRSRVVSFNLPQFSGIVMHCTEPQGKDAIIGLYAAVGPRESCDKNELSCADPATIPFGCDWEWPGIQPGQYYIVVEAFAAGQEGNVGLSLSAVQDRALEICNNGIDDDMDGFTDCADVKCALSPFCSKKACKADVTIDPLPINMMVQAQLDTTNKMASAQPPCEVKPGGGDAVVMVNLPAKSNLKVDFIQGFGSTNHVIAVYPILAPGLTCEASKALSCQPTMGLKNGTVTFPALAAGKYWVIVAADKPGDEGPIFLDFTATP